MKPVTSIFLLSCVLLGGSVPAWAQKAPRSQGPLVKDYGEVFAIESPDFSTPKDKPYRVLFDIYASPEDPASLNPQINTLARFLNMHAQAGVPPENLHVACVFHNLATKDVMNSEAYEEKYGVPNPNEPLLEALEAAGANIYLCGQSMHARGLERERLAKPVKVALSAMTVILALQSEGYQLIKF